MSFEESLASLFKYRNDFREELKAWTRADVAEKFLASEEEGTCPKCGSTNTDFNGSGDEGGAANHFLIHEYRCLDCRCEWSEEFHCVPTLISIDKD